MTVDTSLVDLISAYLDGELEVEQTRRLEQRLHEPEARLELARELMLRDFLQSAGPDAPPADLMRQLEAAVTRGAKVERDGARASRLETLRAALAGMGWMARGLVAVGSAGGTVYDAGQTAYGLGSAVVKTTQRLRAPQKKPSTVRRLGAMSWKLLGGK